MDAALRYGRGDWEGLCSERLFGEWIAPVAAPALLARMAGADPHDLSGWPLLADPQRSNRWFEWFGRFGGSPPPRYVAQFDTVDALRHAALGGLGVGLGRMVTFKSLIDAERLRVLGDHYLPVPEAYCLVYPPRSHDHRGLQAFRGWLLAEAQDYCRQMPMQRQDASADG